MTKETGEDVHAVWRTIFLTLFIPLLPALMLLPRDRTFSIDWNNIVWPVGYFGEYFRQHWAFPIVINTFNSVGMPLPIFYGVLLLPICGLISAFTGAGLAVRIVAYAVMVLQNWNVRCAARALGAGNFSAWSIAAIMLGGTYPLSNLYHRSAVAEFVAVSLLISVVALLVRCSVVTERNPNRLFARAMLLLAIMMGTHPITAILGSLVVCLLGICLFHPLTRNLTVRPAISSVLAVGLISFPWFYVAFRLAPHVHVAQENAAVNFFGDDIDTLSSRFFPFARDIRIDHNHKPIQEVSTPFLDAQINMPLLVVCVVLIWMLGRAYREGLVERRSAWIAIASWCAAITIAVLSCSARFWQHYTPHVLVHLQFAYRSVSYADLFLLLAAFFGLHALSGRLAPLSRKFAICLIPILLWAGLNVVWKLYRVALITRPIASSGTAFGGSRNELLFVPNTFYGQFDYTLAHSRLPFVDGDPRPVYGANFTVGEGERFGEPNPVAVSAQSAGVVSTNIQVFPWNQIAINSETLPERQMMEGKYLNAVGALGAGLSAVEYRLAPDRLWLLARRLSLGLMFLWILISIAEPVWEHGPWSVLQEPSV